MTQKRKSKCHTHLQDGQEREIQGGADFIQLRIGNYIKAHVGQEDNREQPFTEGGLMPHQTDFFI